MWTDVHVTDSSLARAVTQVRRALGDDIRTPRYIETVPTRGYRFIGALRPLACRWRHATVDSCASGGSPADALGAGPDGRRAARLAMAAVLRRALAWRAPGRGAVAASQAAPAELGAMFLSAIAHDAVQVTTSRGLDADPALSPDGSAVAYASDASGALEIHVRSRVAGATGRAVTDNGGDNVDPAWSPDGQWLAYHSRRFGGVWLVPAAGSRPATRGRGASPSWSPDGRTLVFQTAGEADILGGTGGSPSTLRLVDVATGQVERADPAGRRPRLARQSRLAAGPRQRDLRRRSRAGGRRLADHARRPRDAARCLSCVMPPVRLPPGGVTWVGALRRGKGQELWLAPVGPRVTSTCAGRA